MTDEPAVLTARRGGVGEIVLNRPDQRNALNMVMCEGLYAAAVEMARDPDVRAVVVSANGPVFCAGADLKERKGMSAADVTARRVRAFAAYDALEAIAKPVVAMVHGPAVGSGCEIATACDFAIGSEKASFRYPEVVWGSVGATQRLPRIVGKRMAKDILFTGRTISAEEALWLGLTTRVVAGAQLRTTVDELADGLAALPPDAVRLAKRCLDDGAETDRRGALAIEMMAIEELLATADWRSRINGFGVAG